MTALNLHLIALTFLAGSIAFGHSAAVRQMSALSRSTFAVLALAGIGMFIGLSR